MFFIYNNLVIMIKDFRKNCKKFYFSLGINLLFFIFFNLLFYSRYHTVDDVFMQMIVCGAFGKPDPHLVYTNVIPGFILTLFYSVSSKMPWYGLMHIGLSFISLSVITYVFFNRNNTVLKNLILVLVFITSYEAYTKIQFTKTAAYLAVAGYVLVIYSLESERRIIKQITSIILLWLSYSIRPSMFFGVSAICLGFLLPRFVFYLINIKNKNERRNLKQLLLVGICSLLLVGTSFLVDRLSYSGERWSYYKRYDNARSQLYDVYFPSYDEFSDVYSAYGLSAEDRKLFDSGDMNDPDLFGLDTMYKIIALQTNKVFDLDEFVMFALRGYNTLFRQKSLATFTAFALISLFFFVFGCKFDIKKWLALIISSLIALLLFIYTYYMHGWFDRTTISVIFALTVSMLYIMNPIDNKTTKTISIVILCISIIGSLAIWSEYFRWNRKDWHEELLRNQEDIAEVYDDHDHLYISRVSFPMWKLYYTSYDAIKKGTMTNYATYGDWMINSPIYIDAMKEFGVINPYKDIVDNEKVYLIGFIDNLDPIIKYIQRHYYSEAKAVLVKKIGEYEIYSIKSS